MCKLSIIVPVYNVEPYIRRCVDSILSQTFKDFEAILVDDGSPDNCGLIIDEYALKDSRIVPIHQSNKGVSAARNEGLRVAKGAYIGFVDPDDWIEPDMYSILIDAIESFNCDIISCSWFYNNGEYENENHTGLSSQVLSGSEYMKRMFDIPPSISGSVCSKLFVKDIIQIEFPRDYKIGEDHVFLANCCIKCRKAMHIERPLYHVYSRADSATRENPGKIALGLPARIEIIEIAKKVDDECRDLAERAFLDQCIAYSRKTISEPYRSIAIKAFLDYMQKNRILVLSNNSIPLKEKIMYLYHYIQIAKGLE